MAKAKKTYATPAGLRFAASAAFSNALLGWIASFIWQMILTRLRVGGIFGILLSFVGYGFLLYAGIKTYTAFETEIQADAMLHENVDKSLATMKKLTLAVIIIRTILTIIAILINIFLNAIKISPAYRQLNAIIDLLAAVITVINILGWFAYKIYIADGGYQKIKLFSLASLVTVIIHCLTAAMKNILIISAPNGNYRPLSLAASTSAIISYFALFLMFEARKELYCKRMQEKNE
ncbi:MAG: hypothetical protein IJ766_04180 [Clostridia bacterium]|nr:hypothetical protein [Clostridia bacterium]